MGMKVRVNIDTVTLNGFSPSDRKAVLEGLQKELVAVDWTHSRPTPVLRLGQIPFSDARKLGGAIAKTIGKRVKA